MYKASQKSIDLSRYICYVCNKYVVDKKLSTMGTTANDLYDYRGMDAFFGGMSSPQQMAAHLDRLLYFLVYHGHREGEQGIYGVYADVFEFKCVLQDLTKRT